MKVRIKSVKNRPFKGSDGEEVDYFWYKAIRISDNVNFEFGSREGGHVTDVELELNIEKFERPNSKIGYKETS